MNHGEKITGIAFSPDGTRILTTSWDKTAKLWDSKTGRNTATLAQGERELECGSVFAKRQLYRDRRRMTVPCSYGPWTENAFAIRYGTKMKFPR